MNWGEMRAYLLLLLLAVPLVSAGVYESNDTVLFNGTYISTDNTSILRGWDSVNDEDYLTFNATQGYNYLIWTQNESSQSSADTLVRLHMPNGSLLAQNDDYFGNPSTYMSRLLFQAPQNGTYALNVTHSLGSAGGNYSLSITQLGNLSSTINFSTLEPIQNETFTVQSQVQCIGGPCLDVTAILDPQQEDVGFARVRKLAKQYGEVPVIVEEKQSISRSRRAMPSGLMRAQTISGSQKKTMRVTEDDLDILEASGVVERIEYDIPVQSFMDVSRVLINSDDLNLLNVSGINLNGTGQSVCVIDSGINYTHPDFGNCSPTSNINDGSCPAVPGGYDFVNDDADPMDDHLHGTHVAGTITGASGTYGGVAPGSKVIAIKSLNSGGTGSTSDIIAGMNWCIQNASVHNITVISMSLGTADPYLNDCSYASTSMREAINNARAANISVVISAGNNFAEYPELGMSFPACMPNTISVAASDDSDTFASFSKRDLYTDVSAPGVSITAAYYLGGYVPLSGTSMAAPHVSALITLMNQYSLLSFNRTLLPQNIEYMLQTSGKPVTEDAFSNLTLPRIESLNATLRKGVVPMTPNATPFWTNDTNPISCGNMQDGDTCNLSWNVYATGDLGTYEFFTIVEAEYTQEESPRVDVTISQPLDCVRPANGSYYQVNNSITLCRGNYTNLTIEISQDNVEMDCDGSVLNGTDQSSDAIVFTSSPDNTTVRNCYFTQYDDAYFASFSDLSIRDYIINNTFDNNSYGVRIQQNNRVQIMNNTFRNNDWGIEFGVSNENYVSQNVFVNSQYASIYFDSVTIVDDAIIANNEFYNHTSTTRGPIDVASQTDGLTIANNTFAHNAEGSVTFASSLTVQNILFQNNTIYNVSDDDGISVIAVDNITIRDNLFTVIADHGIFVTGTSTQAYLYNNTISNATGAGFAGIRINLNFNDTIIANNTISNFSYPIYLASTARNVSVYNNILNTSVNGVLDLNGSNMFNTSENCLQINIIGGSCIGGNFHVTPSNSGHSQICTNYDADSFCDDVYNDSVVDYLPLTTNTNASPEPTVTIQNPTNNSITNDSTPEIQFIVVDLDNSTINYSVLINGSVDVSGTANNNTVARVNLSSQSDGWYEIGVFVNDSEYTDNATPIHITVDATNPSTTVEAQAGWLSAGVSTINISAMDATSGVAYTNVTIGNTSYLNQTNITINQTGNITIYYYSVDVAGNQEATQNTSVAIDGTAPLVKDLRKSPFFASRNENVSIIAEIVDNTSIVSAVAIYNGTNYTMSPDNASSYFAYINFTQIGQKTVQVVAQDAAGFINDSETITFTVFRRARAQNQTYNTTTTFNFTNETNTTIIIDINKSVNANLSVFYSSAPPETVTSNLSNAVSYVDINFTTNETDVIEWIILQVYYDESSLGNISESSLKIAFYNETNNTWVNLSNGTPPWVNAVGVNTDQNFVWANISHFSTYGVAGDVTEEEEEDSGSGSSGGSGGGGGGGGGGFAPQSASQQSNATTATASLTFFTAGESRFLTFRASSLPLKNATVDISSDGLSGSVLAERVSVDVGKNLVYDQFSLSSSTVEFSEMQLGLEVDGNWLTENGLEPEEVKVLFDGNTWKRTYQGQRDDMHGYLVSVQDFGVITVYADPLILEATSEDQTQTTDVMVEEAEQGDVIDETSVDEVSIDGQEESFRLAYIIAFLILAGLIGTIVSLLVLRSSAPPKRPEPPLT